MAQPISRETAIALAKEAGFKASIGQTVDDKYHPDRNAIGKSVPIEWVQRFYDLAVAHSRKDAEPVAYQYRMKPEWHDAWVKWQPCDKANFDDYVKAPVVNGWQFDARALFNHPPEADKLLQQALEFIQFQKDGRTQSVEAAHKSRDALLSGIRTYLEGKK